MSDVLGRDDITGSYAYYREKNWEAPAPRSEIILDVMNTEVQHLQHPLFAAKL